MLEMPQAVQTRSSMITFENINQSRSAQLLVKCLSLMQIYCMASEDFRRIVHESEELFTFFGAPGPVHFHYY